MSSPILHPHDRHSDQVSPEASMLSSPKLSSRKRVGFDVALGDNVTALGTDTGTGTGTTSDPRSVADTPDPYLSHVDSHAVDPVLLTQSLTQLSQSQAADRRMLKPVLKKELVAPTAALPEALDLAGIDNLPTKQQAYEKALARASGLERDIRSAPGSRSGSPERLQSVVSLDAAVKPRKPRHSRNHSGTGSVSGLWNYLFYNGADRTGQNTPEAEEMEEYFPEPSRYRLGGLSAHWLMNGFNGGTSHPRHDSVDSGPLTPGTSTPMSPREERSSWFSRSPRPSSPSIADLVKSTSSSTAIAGSHISSEYHKAASKRPSYHRSQSSSSIIEFSKGWSSPKQQKKKKPPIDITIKKHIEETLQRRRYLTKLCRALMEYGAPTHRIEAYLAMTARVLEIDAQFLYFPGTMIISFDDPQTHTTEMKLVRVAQGVDLGKMKDTHDVYKDVVHDICGVQEAMGRLEVISKKKLRYPVWIQILAYGFGSAFVGPFAFQARLIDLPIIFGLGCILGVLQLLVAPRSDLYSSVFEIAATIITSFLARFFGSLQHEELFCFSALAQSSIALILPGWTVLSAALELQSRSLVAGSVRIVYAVIYSLWIGYGITIGTAIYGIIDRKASSSAHCTAPLADNGVWIFFFVPAFTLCLAIINQAKLKQMPVMLVIAFLGYLANYYSGKRFTGNAQVASTLGALAIGVLANLYSRTGRRTDAVQARFVAWFKATFVDRGKPRTPKISMTPPDFTERRKSSLVSLLPSLFRRESTTSNDLDIELGVQEKGEYDDLELKPHVKTDSKGKPVRVNYALAAAAMLPAIFVQVPSGLSVTGSLVQGIQSANLIADAASNSSSSMSAMNSTNGGVTVVTASQITDSNGNINSNISFTVAASVVQIAIGITIGLFLGSIVVYPTGKGSTIGKGRSSRSGLFAF